MARRNQGPCRSVPQCGRPSLTSSLACLGARRLELRPRLAVLTEAERMAGWVGVHDEGAARLLHRAGEDDCTESDSPEAGCTKVSHGQVKMKLLRRAIRPIRRRIRRCALEGQLAHRISGVDLTPLRIADVQHTSQKVCVEGRKSRRVGAVEDNSAHVDGG